MSCGNSIRQLTCWPVTISKARRECCRRGHGHTDRIWFGTFPYYCPTLSRPTSINNRVAIRLMLRTSAVKLFTCPDNPINGLFNNGAMSYFGSSGAAARTSANGQPYGAATYAINGQVATAQMQDGHQVKGSTILEKIKDGTSNTVRRKNGILPPGPIIHSPRRRDATGTSPGAFGPVAAATPRPPIRSMVRIHTAPPAPNTSAPTGYTWWDCPVFDCVYTATTNTNGGPGPRGDWRIFARTGTGAWLIQAAFRRIHPTALRLSPPASTHAGVMTAALADGSVRTLSGNMSA